MPVSVASQRDPFRRPGAHAGPTEEKLRIPQARVLRALMPEYPEDPPTEWPLLTRASLSIRAGFSPVSGTTTRVLNGIHEGSSSGDAHPGLLARKLVEAVEVDVVGLVETNFRITAAGIAAFQAYIATGGKLPAVKDASICTNDRYIRDE